MLLYSVHMTSIQYIVHLSELKGIHPQLLNWRFLPFCKEFLDTLSVSNLRVVVWMQITLWFVMLG